MLNVEKTYFIVLSIYWFDVAIDADNESSQSSDLTNDSGNITSSSSHNSSEDEEDDTNFQIMVHHICNNHVRDFNATAHMSPLYSPLSRSFSLFIADEQNSVIVQQDEHLRGMHHTEAQFKSLYSQNGCCCLQKPSFASPAHACKG